LRFRRTMSNIGSKNKVKTNSRPKLYKNNPLGSM
jgi:hypothetical protein